MTVATAFTRLLSIEHPIVLAPMGGFSGGALAAAVSNAGGLGLVGGGRSDREWLERELDIVVANAERPWGVGFLSWATEVAALEQALEREPRAVMLSFGEPQRLVPPIRRAGAALIMQVTDLDEAREAMALGADVIVAQGAEAGGHGGHWATLPFVPVVVDLVTPTPVLAAGGIADGRGIAAALTLGAAGVVMGTRFLTALEALIDPAAAKSIVESGGEDTERSRVSDIARGSAWPPRYSARTLRTPFFDQWYGREAELDANQSAQLSYRDAAAGSQTPPDLVWASQAIDLINDLSPAADLVATLTSQTQEALTKAAGCLRDG